jgi:hypothetical protein
MDWRLSSSHYFRQQLLDYFHLTRITKVTFTLPGGAGYYPIVVWQFWGRAAEAS